MKTLSRLRWPWTFAVTLILVVAGCIVSGQFVIVIPFDKTVESSDTDFDWICIDLSDNSTWNDHKDEIQGIVDLKFEARFTNKLSASITGEVWVTDSAYTTIADVKANGHLFISGIVLEPGQPRNITFSESGAFISNLAEILSVVETGRFYVYGLAADLPFSITIDGIAPEDFARVMITFSAG